MTSDEIRKDSERVSFLPPKGCWFSGYNRNFEPESILDEISSDTSLTKEQQRSLLNIMNYRFFTSKESGKTIKGDRFMAFWLFLMFYYKSTGKSKMRLRHALKKLENELSNSSLTGIFPDWPDERILYEQLYNAARRYITTCRTDKGFTSTMFGFGALKSQQLEEKILAELFDAVCFSYRCGLLEKYPVIFVAALNAFEDEYTNKSIFAIKRIEIKLGEVEFKKFLSVIQL